MLKNHEPVWRNTEWARKAQPDIVRSGTHGAVLNNEVIITTVPRTHRGNLFPTALETPSSAFRFLWFLTFTTWLLAFTAITSDYFAVLESRPSRIRRNPRPKIAIGERLAHIAIVCFNVTR